MLTLRAAQKAVEHLLAAEHAVALVIPPAQGEAPVVIAWESDVFGGLDGADVCAEGLGGAHICDDA
jgi:hypothetical protein